jgi:hypothetical protein
MSIMPVYLNLYEVYLLLSNIAEKKSFNPNVYAQPILKSS